MQKTDELHTKLHDPLLVLVLDRASPLTLLPGERAPGGSAVPESSMEDMMNWCLPSSNIIPERRGEERGMKRGQGRVDWREVGRVKEE
jgi:hypothetical protein